MNKKERQKVVEFVKTEKPIDLTGFALAVANKIRKEGMINNVRRTEIQ